MIRDSIVIGNPVAGNAVISNPLVGNIVTVAANAPFSLSSSSIAVTPNAILGGTGSVVGDVINTGLMIPGLSASGILTVFGNVSQTPDGTIVIQAAVCASTALVVDGVANLNGTLNVEIGAECFAGAGGGPGGGATGGTGPGGGVITIITASGGINGTFTDVNLPENFPFELVFNPTNVQLVFTLQEAVLSEFGLEILLELLDLQDDPLSEALVQLNLIPILDATIKDIIFNAANTQYNQITTRLAAIRSGVNTVTVQGLPQEPLVEQLSKREARLRSKQIVPCTEETLRWDIFASASGIFSAMTNVWDLPRINAATGYFSVGADCRLNEYMNVGIYAGYQGIRNWNDDFWFRSNGVKWGLYGTAFWKGFYLNAIAGGGANFLNLNRSIDLFSEHHIARSHPFAGELDTLLGGGYEYRWCDWIFGINNSIQYTYLGISSSTESGARNLNVRMQSQRLHSLMYTLGGNVSYLWEISPNYRILPTIGLYWQHEFLNYGQRIYGAFANGGGAPFFLDSPDGVRNNAFGVAGITAQIGRVGAYAYYMPQFGNRRFYSNSVVGGLVFNF